MKETTKPMEAFDLETVYDEQINPLMAQIIAICKEHKMPMFASFAYRNDPDADRTSYCTTLINNAEGRKDEVLQRCCDIARNGLPENRAMAFTITERTR